MLLNECQRYQACNAGSSQVVHAVTYIGNAEELGLSFGLASSSRPAAMPRSSKHVCPGGSRRGVYRASIDMHTFPKGYLAILSAVPSEYYVRQYS